MDSHLELFEFPRPQCIRNKELVFKQSVSVKNRLKTGMKVSFFFWFILNS